MRGLVLPEEKLDRIEKALGAHFPKVERKQTRRCTIFDARL
jgi:hypothetical protein